MAFPVINGLRCMEFGIPGESRSRFIDLVINGSKRATASTMDEYLAEAEPIEQVGEKLAVIDNYLKQVATIVVTRVDLCRFADVTDEFPLAEAEGDLNADEFRSGHFKYWSDLGLTITDNTNLVLVYFDLLPSR